MDDRVAGDGPDLQELVPSGRRGTGVYGEKMAGMTKSDPLEDVV